MTTKTPEEKASNVVSLESRRPHMTGQATCFQCKHEWVAVTPIGVHLFECPNCQTDEHLNAHKGYYLNEAVPEDPLRWECDCGCQLFVLSDEYFYCIQCGLAQQF